MMTMTMSAQQYGEREY